MHLRPFAYMVLSNVKLNEVQAGSICGCEDAEERVEATIRQTGVEKP